MKKYIKLIEKEEGEYSVEDIIKKFDKFIYKYANRVMEQLHAKKHCSFAFVDADDIAQELRIKLVKIYEDYEIDKGNFCTYMVKSLSLYSNRVRDNVTKEHCNTQKNRPTRFIHASLDEYCYSSNSFNALKPRIEIADGFDLDNHMINVDDLNVLTDDEKQCLVLYHLYGYSKKEVGLKVGLSINKVNIMINNGENVLKGLSRQPISNRKYCRKECYKDFMEYVLQLRKKTKKLGMKEIKEYAIKSGYSVNALYSYASRNKLLCKG